MEGDFSQWGLMLCSKVFFVAPYPAYRLVWPNRNRRFQSVFDPVSLFELVDMSTCIVFLVLNAPDIVIENL